MDLASLRADARRWRVLIEESPELVFVLDAEGRVLAASRRARASLTNLQEGAMVPEALVRPDRQPAPVFASYDVDGRKETLVYLGAPGQLAAYEELRAGFTAAVSHELRTPLARLLAILDSAELPGVDPLALINDARAEVDQIRELIDDVLFLSELETGRETVSLGATPLLPLVQEVFEKLSERALRAGVALQADIPKDIQLPMRPRMVRVIVQNLAENAVRYSGPGATFTLAADRTDDATILSASDTGSGVSDDDLPRLFERFYRADRARSSRGTGLGLAIVKHIVTSAGGNVDAANIPGSGLQIRCTFLR